MEGELKLSVTQISLEDNKTVQLAADGVSRKRYFFTRGGYVGGWARWELLLTKIKALNNFTREWPNAGEKRKQRGPRMEKIKHGIEISNLKYGTELISEWLTWRILVSRQGIR